MRVRRPAAKPNAFCEACEVVTVTGDRRTSPMKRSGKTLTDVEALLVRKIASLLPGQLRREGTTLDVHVEVAVGSNIADLVHRPVATS